MKFVTFSAQDFSRAGVLLGDGVQGNEQDRYDFDATGVEILYNDARQTYRFRVEL